MCLQTCGGFEDPECPPDYLCYALSDHESPYFCAPAGWPESVEFD